MAIAQVQFESWSRAYRGVLADDYIACGLEQDIKQVWADWDSEKLVVGAVQEDRSLVGFAAYIMSDQPSDMAYLDNFHVDHTHHGTGLAQRLFCAGADEIEKHGAGGLWLTVLESNARARAFYAKMGGAEGEVQRDEMLGTQVQAVPVHWYDLQGLQKINQEA